MYFLLREEVQSVICVVIRLNELRASDLPIGDAVEVLRLDK